VQVIVVAAFDTFAIPAVMHQQVSDIDQGQKMGRSPSYERPQDRFNIISGKEKSNQKVEAPKLVAASDVDLITGQKKKSPTPTHADAEKFRAASAQQSAKNNDASVNIINGQPIPEDHQRHGLVSRGSFSKELKENLASNVDPITLRTIDHNLLRQGVPPPAAVPVGGIFLDFPYIDANSIRCAKCSKPLYISSMFAQKGAYVHDKAVYNAQKGGHPNCFYHPGKHTADDMSKVEFTRWTCCLGSVDSDGCTLKQ